MNIANSLRAATLFSRQLFACTFTKRCLVTQSKRAKSKERMAATNANANAIVWVDLEMSGLNINTEHILEIACLITDQELNVTAKGPEIVIKQSDELLDGMDSWCKKTHGASGLTQRVRESQIDLAKAEEMMLAFLKENNVPKGQCPLAGNSIHVDRMFLDKYMPKFLGHLHYRIVDVSTIKELSKRWYPEEKSFPKKNTHRALDDIRESIQELKHYRERLFKPILD